MTFTSSHDPRTLTFSLTPSASAASAESSWCMARNNLCLIGGVVSPEGSLLLKLRLNRNRLLEEFDNASSLPLRSSPSKSKAMERSLPLAGDAMNCNYRFLFSPPPRLLLITAIPPPLDSAPFTFNRDTWQIPLPSTRSTMIGQ